MLIFDGLDFQTRIIKLRPRQVDTCIMCQYAIKAENNLSLEVVKEILDKFDYNQFCGVSNYNDKTLDIKVLGEEQRISCLNYKEILPERHLLIDVRPKCQFKICRLPNSISSSFEFIIFFMF